MGWYLHQVLKPKLVDNWCGGFGPCADMPSEVLWGQWAAPSPMAQLNGERSGVTCANSRQVHPGCRSVKPLDCFLSCCSGEHGKSDVDPGSRSLWSAGCHFSTPPPLSWVAKEAGWPVWTSDGCTLSSHKEVEVIWGGCLAKQYALATMALTSQQGWRHFGPAPSQQCLGQASWGNTPTLIRLHKLGSNIIEICKEFCNCFCWIT